MNITPDDRARRDLQLMTIAALNVSDNGLNFLRAYCAATSPDLDELLYLLEKPHKYADEFGTWLDADQPTSDADPGWDVFVEILDQ